jgi:hypothetical protein
MKQNDFNLGVNAYEQGNYKTAFEKLFPFAEQGDAKAQGILGLLYANGNGVEENFSEAAKWFQKSAEQGNQGAYPSLCLLYATGQGVPQDFIEAYKWLFLSEDIEGFQEGINDLRKILDGQASEEQIAQAKDAAKIWMKQQRKEFDVNSFEELLKTFEKIQGLPQTTSQFLKLYQEMEPLLREINLNSEEIKGNAQQRLLAISKLFALYTHTSACLAGSVLVLRLLGNIVEFIWDELTKEQQESINIFVETLSLDPEIQESSNQLVKHIKKAQEKKQEVLQLIKLSK